MTPYSLGREKRRGAGAPGLERGQRLARRAAFISS
jgi:hypothetical protein